MLRGLLIATLATIIAVGISWRLLRPGSMPRKSETPSAASNGEERVAELEEEVARMKQQMRVLSAQPGMAARQTTGAVAAPAPDQGPDKKTASNEDPDVAMAKGRQAILNKFNQLSVAMAREARDPAWAETAEKELGMVVKQIQESGVKGATVLSSECKSSLCRVEVAYDNVQTQAQVSDRIRSPLFSGGEVRRYDENGQLRSTAYYYREGYERPM